MKTTAQNLLFNFLKKQWLLFCLINCVCLSKILAQNVNVEEENSNKYKYYLFLNPVYGEMSTGELFRVAADVRTLVNPVPRLWGDFSFQHAYFGSNKAKFTISGAESEYKPFQDIEIGARYALIDRVKNRRTKIILGSEYRGGQQYTRYVIVKVPKRRVFAFRGGLYANRQHASTRWGLIKTGEEPQVKATDGTILGGGWDPILANTRTQGICAGFSFTTIANTTYNFNLSGGGKKTFESCFLNDLTFDFMYQLNSSIADFIVGGKSYAVEAGKNDTFQIRNFGLKMGYNHLTFYKTVGLSLGIDVGFRPGISQSSLYFGCKAGISFSK